MRGSSGLPAGGAEPAALPEKSQVGARFSTGFEDIRTTLLPGLQGGLRMNFATSPLSPGHAFVWWHHQASLNEAKREWQPSVEICPKSPDCH
jgi:hypothetical protein